MTRVTVDPGICGFITAVEVEKIAEHKVKVTITSDCDQVKELGQQLTLVEPWEAIKQHFNCEIYEAASRCHLHVTCPVPVAILKAIEVEAGLALSRDAVIHFEVVEPE
jgi:hypothetical protein